jgi:hypothetical protein
MEREFTVWTNTITALGILLFSTQQCLIVKADVQEFKERVEIDLIAIDGKEIVSIDQSFEDEIKDKIVGEL